MGKFSRSVSIIGVGCTPFTNTLKNPETKGLVEGELYGYAAIEAMQDAGINPRTSRHIFMGRETLLCLLIILLQMCRSTNGLEQAVLEVMRIRKHAVPDILL